MYLQFWSDTYYNAYISFLVMSEYHIILGIMHTAHCDVQDAKFILM